MVADKSGLTMFAISLFSIPSIPLQLNISIIHSRTRNNEHDDDEVDAAVSSLSIFPQLR